MKEAINYTNGEVTVVWKPNVCIHATLCWKELVEVFNPRERPWVKMNGAATNKIIEQVRKCPSGALSYFLNEQGLTEEPATGIIAEAAQVVKVEVRHNGPYLIQSECLIVHSDGREETKTGSVALCRCGASANKPYCDGAHQRIGFNDKG